MTNASGLLSKTSKSQYHLLTMEGEFLITGNLSLHNGFHSIIDLSNVVVSQYEEMQFVSSGTFNSKKITIMGNGIDGRGDCDCGDCSDECDCQTDCACTGECDCD